MSRKLFLPLTQGDARPPTVDAMRKRLGGRASTEPGAGELVSLTTERGIERIGVVLFVRGEDLDVWTDGDVVRRARRASLRPVEDHGGEGASLGAIVTIARDARSFAALREGQQVRYQHEGGIGEGTLVEKCRFGALIERVDGAVIGAGFRRIWAAFERAQN